MIYLNRKVKLGKKNKFFGWYGLFSLIRINNPIGFFLFLWPTLWTLWLSNQRSPDIYILIMFIVGVFLVRSLGCIINDYFDKDIDGYVKRTKNRPLSCGLVSEIEALVLFFVFLSMSCILLFMIDFRVKTVFLSLIVLLLICVYPCTKRCMFFPQFFLGVTFASSTFIIFFILNICCFKNILFWLLFVINIIWVMVYDTEYAMVDRDDDISLGLNSSAVYLGSCERIFIGILQVLMLFLFVIIGLILKLRTVYYIALIGVSILFMWQQVLIMNRDRDKCFQAFLSNNYVGMLIFVGVMLDFLIL